MDKVIRTYPNRLKKLTSAADASLAKRALSSTVAGTILFAISFVQSILIVPILLKHWGQEKYGIWIAVWAFVILMRTFDMGHLSYIGNEYLKHFFTDRVKARKILSSGVRMAFVLGVCELLFYALLVITGIAGGFVGIDGAGNDNIQGAIFVALIPWALAGSFVSVILRAIPAFGKYTEMIYFSVIMKVAELIVLILCGIFNASILEVSIWISVATVLYVAGIILYTRKLMNEDFPSWALGEWKQAFVNLFKSLSLTVNSVMEQYLNSGVILLIARSLSLSFVALFSTVRTLTNSAVQVTSLMMDPLTPDLIRFYSANHYDKIRQIFITNWFIMALLINLPIIVIMPFLDNLYSIWTAHKLPFDEKLFFFLAVGVSVANFGRPFILIIRTLNKLVALNVITGARLLIVFGISIPFVSHGLWVVGMAFLVSEIVCSVLIPIYFFHRSIFTIRIVDYIKGFVPTIILAGFFVSVYIAPYASRFLSIAFLLLQLMFSYYCWRSLASEVKLRLVELVPERILRKTRRLS